MKNKLNLRRRHLVSLVAVILLGLIPKFKADATVFPVNCWYDVDGDGYLELLEKYYYNLNVVAGYGDFDNDGTIEVLLGNGTIGRYENPWVETEISTDDFAPDCSTANAFSLADIDNDGRMEMLYGYNQDANGCQSNYLKFFGGQYFSNVLDVVDTEGEYQKPIFGATSGLPSVGDGMFVGGTASTKARSEAKSIDINGDGLNDIITNIEIFTSIGNGTFLQDGIFGTLLFRDFNNDGVLDYVGNLSSSQKVSLFLINSDGSTPSEVKLLTGVVANSELFCYDFDKDGDVDILIPCDRSINGHDNGASYLVLMENQGNGKFKRHENYIEGTCYFKSCVDINGDGLFEIFYEDRTTYPYSSYYRTIGADWKISDPVEVQYGIYRVSNLNGDGRMYGYYNNDSNGKKGNYLLSNYVNQRPVAPGKPSISYDRSKAQLTVSWGYGSDKESSAVDLSYAMRIGTSPDAQDIVYSHALNDGRRRDLREGNMGYAHKRVFDVSTWPKGKYYISVQSVDPNCLGSKFSETVVFDKTDDAVGFDVMYSKPFGVGDICTVISRTPNNKFDFGEGAEIVESGYGEIATYKVKYTTPGKKTIRLKDNDIKTFQLEVCQSSVGNESFIFDDQKYSTSINLSLDVDEDGRPELMAQYSNNSPNYSWNKFFQANHGNPNEYTSIKRLWNTNIPVVWYSGSASQPADVNNDGKSDVTLFIAGELTILYNEGDCDFSIEGIDLNRKLYVSSIFDVNNDGYLDCYYNSSRALFVNEKDYGKYSEKKGFTIDAWLDINRDGLIDYIGYADNIKGEYIFLNKGNLTFERDSGINNSKVMKYALLDEDNTVDIIGNEEILWGDGSSTPIPGYYLSEIRAIADVDNDGFDDIISYAKNKFTDKYNDIIMYQRPDHIFEIVKYDKSALSHNYGNLFFRDADGRMRMGGLVLTADNTRPKAPGNLRYTQNNEYVVIEWDHAEDAESSPWQMQYCLSMKKKGMEGEGAYVFSPLNGGNENVPLPQPYPYIKANRFTIPIENLAPGEYEVRVQALDAWMEQSPFSGTLNLTVKASADFNMPVSARVDSPVTVELLTNTSVTPDFDGATVVSKDGNSYSVVWNTAGEKTVSAGSVSQKITVIDAPQGDFSIAAEAYMGDTRIVECDNPMSGRWSCTLNGKDADEKCAILFKDNKLSATFQFPGTYTIIHTVSDFNGEYEYAHEVKVTKAGTIDIDFVNCDGESGKLAFTVLKGNDMQIAYDVYKETSVAGTYSKIAENQPFGVPFIDQASSPALAAARYKVCGLYADGSVSSFSEIHQSVHLMLNRGIGNGWNLIWSKYEGREIASYNILRGASPASLSVIATVSGSLSSYSDTDAPSGRFYYAVQPVPASTSPTVGRSDIQARSNVVSTDDARSVDYATSIVIVNMGASDEVNETTDAQLVAYITPVSATIRNLNWTITEGSGYAEIDQYGVVRVKPGNGGGNIIVNASTVDGTDLTATYTLHYAAPAVEVTSIALSDNAIIGSVGDDFTLSATLSPENASDRRVSYRSTDESVVYIDGNGYGIFIGEGEADIIVASVSNPSVMAACHVKVYDGAGVNGIHNDDISVEVFNGEVTVKGVPYGQRVAILNIAGATVFNHLADGDVLTCRPLVKGVYIVVAGSVIKKVIVN